eukprot:scaffold39496_cov36-Phaeocystis_antarctica.AAC.1
MKSLGFAGKSKLMTLSRRGTSIPGQGLEGHVDTARRDVGDDEHHGLARTEARESDLARCRVERTVDARAAVAGLEQHLVRVRVRVRDRVRVR